LRSLEIYKASETFEAQSVCFPRRTIRGFLDVFGVVLGSGQVGAFFYGSEVEAGVQRLLEGTWDGWTELAEMFFLSDEIVNGLSFSHHFKLLFAFLELLRHLLKPFFRWIDSCSISIHFGLQKFFSCVAIHMLLNGFIHFEAALVRISSLAIRFVLISSVLRFVQ
jgi:hypothetical protein